MPKTTINITTKETTNIYSIPTNIIEEITNKKNDPIKSIPKTIEDITTDELTIPITITDKPTQSPTDILILLLYGYDNYFFFYNS